MLRIRIWDLGVVGEFGFGVGDLICVGSVGGEKEGIEDKDEFFWDFRLNEG